MARGIEADPVTVTVFLLLFVGVAGAGLFAARWRRGDLSQLTEWGLGGRRFGPFKIHLRFRTLCE